MPKTTLLSGKEVSEAVYAELQPRITQLKQQGINANIIYPDNYGLSFYGKCLFTSELVVKKQPEITKDVIKVIVAGWKYALNNKKEIVNVILKK